MTCSFSDFIIFLLHTGCGSPSMKTKPMNGALLLNMTLEAARSGMFARLFCTYTAEKLDSHSFGGE